MVEHAVTPERSRVVVEMWSDLGCPWCYVGKHRLEAAVARRSDAERFEVAIRSFELDPTAPHEPEKVEAAYLRSHGGTADNFLRAEGRAQQMAHAEGLEFSFDRLSASTFDLHRVVQYAGDQGRGFAFFSRVQDGYFAGTLNPFDEATLVGVATSVGLEGGRVAEVLAGDEYADRVRTDRKVGLELGVTGVPFVVVDRRVAVAGAQQIDGYGELLDHVAGPMPGQRVS